MARQLRDVGLQKDQVIFFLTNNSADIAAFVFAALCLGCAIAGRRSSSSKFEHIRYLSVIKPKYVFCDVEYYAFMKECLMDLKIEAKFFTFGGQIGESISLNDLLENDDMDTYFV